MISQPSIVQPVKGTACLRWGLKPGPSPKFSEVLLVGPLIRAWKEPRGCSGDYTAGPFLEACLSEWCIHSSVCDRHCNGRSVGVMAALPNQRPLLNSIHCVSAIQSFVFVYVMYDRHSVTALRHALGRKRSEPILHRELKNV